MCFSAGTRGTECRLRYDSIILWLDCWSADQLDQRLNLRVDRMVNNGLFDEIERIHRELHYQKKTYNSFANQSSIKFGVEQAIGYKEIQDYFEKEFNGDGDNEQLNYVFFLWGAA